MRRAALIVIAIALGCTGSAQAKRKTAPAPAPVVVAPPPLPTSVDRLDFEQMKVILKSFGWNAEFTGGGKDPYLGVWSKLGMPYTITGVQCPDDTGRNCEAIRLWYRNPVQHPDAAGISRRINQSQFFLRSRFQPSHDGSPPYLFPERTIILKGGVTPAQIAANLVEFDRWIIDLVPNVGYALPASYTGPRTAPVAQSASTAPSGSGLVPGRYRTTINNSNGTFSEDICMTASDMREPIHKIAADLTNGGSGCSISGGDGSVRMQCTGRIVDGNILASGMSSSLRWSGNALINTDGLGGRDRIQFQGSASRIGDC